MFNQLRLKEVLVNYKQDFSTRWEDEKYKWEAVKWFQDNWNINASDFSNMLQQSIAKTDNLLTSKGNFPAGMIQGFADAAPEEVRAMFIALYDESRDVVERILEFKDKSSLLLKKYGNGAAQHYQYENAISIYLWLRYPDKYYVYKFSEARVVAGELDANRSIKKGYYAENLRNFYSLYDEICAYISSDKELTNMMKKHISDSCYKDPEYKTLTVDVGFYISRFFTQKESQNKNKMESEWLPTDYDPEITTDTWIKLLNNPNIFTESSLQIMKRMKDYGGQATCSQLSEKYGEEANFYNSGSVALAQRVAKTTDCLLNIRDTEKSKWWPVLYIGRYADADEKGVFVWKLRDELSKALDKMDLSNVKLFADKVPDEERKYWWLNANPKMWSLSGTPVGELQSYTLYNDNGNKRRIFQNFLDAKTGDMVIGYESYPIQEVVAICKIAAEQDGEELLFEKVENLTYPIKYNELKVCPELAKMEYFANPQGSLFKLTKDEYDFIMDLIRESNPILSETKADKYGREDFLQEVFMPAQSYDRLVDVLKSKKNLILQGAPGVGKTYAAKRLAYSIMGECDDDRVQLIQFHQNYSYEDFMMGYKPTEEGFELKTGVFYQFCQKASNYPGKDYFFIIDEINRGNMSKIFGELLMLIEKDYRGTNIIPAYGDRPFSVPENLYIIGMMNTADRSLALIDYALRRRFSFYDMDPGFDSDVFVRYQKDLDNETFDRLIDVIKDLNRKITSDSSLGKGFRIGHSYFSNWEKDECTEEHMLEVVDFEIIPMLSEYWFDDETMLQLWSNNLHGVFQ